MTSFEYVDTLWSLCADNEELKDLLEVVDDEDYETKIRTEDVMPEGYEPENLPFIAIYIADTQSTYNDFANLSNLYIDIYSSMRNNVPAIRKILVDMRHDNCDERVRSEMQTPSGIHAVYKYRLIFTPLIST